MKKIYSKKLDDVYANVTNHRSKLLLPLMLLSNALVYIVTQDFTLTFLAVVLNYLFLCINRYMIRKAHAYDLVKPELENQGFKFTSKNNVIKEKKEYSLVITKVNIFLLNHDNFEREEIYSYDKPQL